jgi:hypothetical protein
VVKVASSNYKVSGAYFNWHQQTRPGAPHMAANTPLLRLLPLLLLLLPHSVREYLTASNGPPQDGGGVSELHPIVLLAGLGCSDIEARLTDAYRPSVPRCGAMKRKGWFGLWHNTSDLLALDYVQCFEEQMRLVYDPAVNDYRNLPGVETRVPKFGSAGAFQDKNPHHPYVNSLEIINR